MLNLDFTNYKGTKWLKDWWKVVRGHFNEVQSAVNANEMDILNEATERQNQDRILQTNINEEATERERQVNTLTDNVNDLIRLYDVVDNNTYLADDIDEPPAPGAGVLFKFYNNTSSTVRTGFPVQIGDETFIYKFSEPIYPRETCLCVVTLTPKPDDGEIYVIKDKELRSLVETANANITAETAARAAADNTINQRINDIDIDKSLTFTSRTLPAPYVVAPQQSDSTAIDIDLSGLFTINGRSCGTMNTVTVDTSCAPNTKHIVVAFDINTENITVTSSDSTVTANITNGVWKFSLANYLVPVYYNDDDPDDPDYGKYVIRGAVYNWDIPTTQGHGYITAEYNPITELRNIITEELGTLSASLDAVNGG